MDEKRFAAAGTQVRVFKDGKMQIWATGIADTNTAIEAVRLKSEAGPHDSVEEFGDLNRAKCEEYGVADGEVKPIDILESS